MAIIFDNQRLSGNAIFDSQLFSGPVTHTTTGNLIGLSSSIIATALRLGTNSHDTIGDLVGSGSMISGLFYRSNDLWYKVRISISSIWTNK